MTVQKKKNVVFNLSKLPQFHQYYQHQFFNLASHQYYQHQFFNLASVKFWTKKTILCEKCFFFREKKCLTANFFRHRIFLNHHRVLMLLLHFSLLLVTLTLTLTCVQSHITCVVCCIFSLLFFLWPFVVFVFIHEYCKLSLWDGSFRFYFPKRKLWAYIGLI